MQKKLSADLAALAAEWTTLYADTLPTAAKARDPAQPRWPVTLDHCFARIILDNTIGKAAGPAGEDVQWDRALQRPAVRNMNAEQFEAAIALGQKIQRGQVDLVELDKASLQARGENEGKYGEKARGRKVEKEVKEEVSTGGDGAGDEDQQSNSGKSIKRKRSAPDEGDLMERTKMRKPVSRKQQSTLGFTPSDTREQLPSPDTTPSEELPNCKSSKSKQPARSTLEQKLDTTSQLPRDQMISTLKRIQSHRDLTPFRKRLYTSLLSVPRGQYTTYAALAKHLDSVARAVGNGMRNNPFAPDVPCHRVLASDGKIGGFGGDWSRDGILTEKQNMKVKLLEDEGVKFDSQGKVKGPVWKGFWDLERFEKEYGRAK